ncbi:MAG: SIMPL domain-containing protein [Caldilineaceae bacterium]|nr:SIMPL domain-containing protein [Caldilineaceae bacterium]
MPQTNPFRMAVDIGMILAFTLTAFFVLFSATTPAWTDAVSLAPAGTHPVPIADKGVVSTEPHIATAVIGMEVLRPTVKEAVSAAQTVVTDVWDALHARNIAPSDIRISHYNIYAEPFGPDGIRNEDEMRYHASNTIFVTIRDLDSIDAVLDAAIDAGASNIYSVDFTLPDPAAVDSETHARAGPRQN